MTIRVCLILLCLWRLSASGLAAESRMEEYGGCCDASAAVALGPDHFVVGDDESNYLRVYKRGSREPVESVPLGAFLRSRNARAEADIEGAARIGDVIYWITSHSLGKDGKGSVSRERFFATRILRENGSKPTVEPFGAPPRGLIEAFASAPSLKQFDLLHAASIEPKDPGGLSIEGLAATAQGTILIGFRNPTPQGKALVVEMTNPKAVVEGAEAAFGPARLLPLGGLGVRDLFFDGRRTIISAGPTDGKGAFQFFAWAGGDASPSGLKANIPRGFHPEAVFRFPGGREDHFYLLSDDGKLNLKEGRCNELSDQEQRFRLLEVKVKGRGISD